MNLIYFTASYLVVNVIISYIVAVVYKLACFALYTLLLLTLEAIQGKCEHQMGFIHTPPQKQPPHELPVTLLFSYTQFFSLLMVF